MILIYIQKRSYHCSYTFCQRCCRSHPTGQAERNAARKIPRRLSHLEARKLKRPLSRKANSIRIRTTQSNVEETSISQPEYTAQGVRSLRRALTSEPVLVAAILLVAAALRLALASRGWPYSN